MIKFNEYIKSIAPAKKGTLAIAVCLVIIPLVADLFLLFVNVNLHEQIWMSGFLAGCYVKYLPLFVVYLLLFFAGCSVYKKLFKK